MATAEFSKFACVFQICWHIECSTFTESCCTEYSYVTDFIDIDTLFRIDIYKMFLLGTYRVAQWLQLCAPIARAEARLIRGQGTRTHMLQLRVHMLQ